MKKSKTLSFIVELRILLTGNDKNFLNKNNIEQLNKLFNNLEENDTENFNDNSLYGWQESINKNKKITIYNNIDFIKNSLMCEYAYIFDLDTQKLEFYEGFQKEPDIYGRYNNNLEPSPKYYPCKKVLEFDYNEIKDVDLCVNYMNNPTEYVKKDTGYHYFVVFWCDNKILNDLYITNEEILTYNDIKKIEKILYEKYDFKITIINWKKLK